LIAVRKRNDATAYRPIHQRKLFVDTAARSDRN